MGREESHGSSRPPVQRRAVLRAGLGLGVTAGLCAAGGRANLRARSVTATAPRELSSLTPDRREALEVLGRTSLRQPGSLPFPDRPAGTDMLPGIEHIVVLMMENHSYDNVLGMSGIGDGFTLDAKGRPTASNPTPGGAIQRAFPMPTTCQLEGFPSQEWKASHVAYDNGRLQGFVTGSSHATPGTEKGSVAMGYWVAEDLPFTYSLAREFCVGDRWFCSLLGQTVPNRRFLIAGTSGGETDDVTTDKTAANLASFSTPAKEGTIFDRLEDQGISWTDYAVTTGLPGTTPSYWYANDHSILNGPRLKHITTFVTDAANGTLPQFSFIDPTYAVSSQENPQNVVVGEALIAKVVHALGTSPSWRSSLLLITYDEHGGYYDHVPPPVALAPDSIAPIVEPGEPTYDGFRRYGFRVPTVVVSPYARRHAVTHVVHDHTSMLAMVEAKWNLPAMTYRDANANSLMDFLDTGAFSRKQPTFPELPRLAAPGDTPEALACSTSGPGAIPPGGSLEAKAG